MGLCELCDNLVSINPEKVEALYIDCREGSELTLSEMYKVTVARDIRNYLQQKNHHHNDLLLLTELTMMMSCRHRTYQLSEHLASYMQSRT